MPGTRAGNIPWDWSADQLPGWFGEETAPARPTTLDAAVAGLQAQAPPGTDWRLGDLVRYLAAHPVRPFDALDFVRGSRVEDGVGDDEHGNFEPLALAVPITA